MLEQSAGIAPEINSAKLSNSPAPMLEQAVKHITDIKTLVRLYVYHNNHHLLHILTLAMKNQTRYSGPKTSIKLTGFKFKNFIHLLKNASDNFSYLLQVLINLLIY